MCTPWTRCVLTACLMIAAQPPRAAAQSAEDLTRKVADYTAFIDAESAKSPLCRGYIGKTVVPVPFDALARRLAGASEKGEFETTAQYRARVAAAGAPPTAPVVVSVPVDRDQLRYDADAGAVIVAAGAFRTGAFSDAVMADVAGGIALGAAKIAGTRLSVGVGASERTLGTEAARNILGVQVRITNVERHTRGLSLSGDRLFAFARVAGSTVTGFEIPTAQAARLKGSLGAALAIVPEEPYVVRGTLNGPAATARKPVHYTELSTILLAAPRCGLILDPQGRVLASADAGAALGGR